MPNILNACLEDAFKYRGLADTILAEVIDIREKIRENQRSQAGNKERRIRVKEYMEALKELEKEKLKESEMCLRLADGHEQELLFIRQRH